MSIKLELLSKLPVSIKSNSYICMSANSDKYRMKFLNEFMNQNSELSKVLIVSKTFVSDNSNFEIISKIKDPALKELLILKSNDYDLIVIDERFKENQRDWFENEYSPNIMKPVLFLRGNNQGPIFHSKGNNEIMIYFGEDIYISNVECKCCLMNKSKEWKIQKYETLSQLGYSEDLKELNDKLKTIEIDLNLKISSPCNDDGFEVIRFKSLNHNDMIEITMRNGFGCSLLFREGMNGREVDNLEDLNVQEETIEDMKILNSLSTIKLLNKIIYHL